MLWKKLIARSAMTETSRGFEHAQRCLSGRRWTPEEADHLRKLILAGEAGSPPPENIPTPMHDALRAISADLASVHRYRNMKSFPVVVVMCKKAANRAAEAIGYRIPYENPYEI